MFLLVRLELLAFSTINHGNLPEVVLELDAQLQTVVLDD